MKTVTKTEFDAFISEHASAASIRELREEKDGAYGYECYDDEDNEVAFVSWPNGNLTYNVRA